MFLKDRGGNDLAKLSRVDHPRSWRLCVSAATAIGLRPGLKGQLPMRFAFGHHWHRRWNDDYYSPYNDWQSRRWAMDNYYGDWDDDCDDWD